MSTRPDDAVDNDEKRPDPTVQQWAKWLHELTVDRPAVRDAIDRCLRTLVLDARRRQMLAQLDGLTEQDLGTVAALIASLLRHPPTE